MKTSKLIIQNFKSIKYVEINCKKVNIFIGEPNTGKSNILEAFGMLSAFGHGGYIDDFVRVNSFSNLFFEDSYQDPITISYNDLIIEIEIMENDVMFKMKDDSFESNNMRLVSLDEDVRKRSLQDFINIFTNKSKLNEFKNINYYQIPNLSKKYEYRGENLQPPFGENLFDVINNSKTLRNFISDVLIEFDYKLNLIPGTKSITIAREDDGVISSYELNTVADTIISYILHAIAIKSNKDKILVFEEPEGHIFPHYIKELAELIAEDKNNTFFITSHNPYFFDSIISKVKEDDLQINLVYSKDYQTKVKQLTKNDYVILLKGDPFFALHELIPED